MPRFPIQYTKQTISGRGPGARADIDVSTGGQAIAGAISGIGKALKDEVAKYNLIEANTQFDKAKRLSREEINRLSISLSGNLNPETYDDNFNKTMEAIHSYAPKNKMAAKAFDSWLQNMSPQWGLGIQKSKQVRIEKNWEDEFLNLKIEAERTGNMKAFQIKVASGKMLGFYGEGEATKLLQDTEDKVEENQKKNILNEWQKRVAENPAETAVVLNDELTARGKNKGVIPEEILPSETIQSLLNSATNRKAQLITQSGEAFNNRKGNETERLSGLLTNGELTDQEIEGVDLQALGAQKEEEFKWKQNWKKILRDTIQLSEPIISNDITYDSLTTGSELVERGTKSPAEWEQEFVQAWADGKLTKEDRRTLRSKDIVATKTMQSRTFSESSANTRPRLVELRDDELAGLIAARDNALKIKDLKTVNALNYSIKKAQIQKWNFGRWRQGLRAQIAQNPTWSQKQIFVAQDILAENFDKDISDLMKEFESANPQESILKTPPSDELSDVWGDLSQEDKAKIWELRLLGASIKEIIGVLPE